MQELLAAGARPRRTALSGIESLTPSELRVTQLAADGMTNREIAQALFVTEKTVETHLGHVFPKLDVSSRAELPMKLERANREEPAELVSSGPG
jgi:DNA-binding CsgD family transcriptional regulator